MRILVIVPAYNEEHNIGGVIEDLRARFPSGDILVINDGSRDHTSEIARGMGATVVDLPYNLGIGGAMQTGFRYAAQSGYDAAVQFDGDGQHCAEDIPKILAPIEQQCADLVVGSRFRSDSEYKSTFQRTIGRKVFSLILFSILGKYMTDCTSGFRAYGRRTVELFASFYAEDYPEVEALVLAQKKGLRIQEAPVRMKVRGAGKSSITPLRAFYYMIKVLLAIFIDLLRKTDK